MLKFAFQQYFFPPSPHLALASVLFVAVACGDGSVQVPDHYTFSSRLGVASSVNYSGQTLRHVLISDLVRNIGSMTERIDSDSWNPSPGDVVEELHFYYLFSDDLTFNSVPHEISSTLPTLQQTYGDISSGKSLQEKVAGNDPVGQHKDWTKDFVGWPNTSPDSLVLAWMKELEDLAIDRAKDIPENPQIDPLGNEISKVYVTETGLDIQQLLQKFLLGAIAFSQGADDYLDDDAEGKGLLSDHSTLVEGKDYTELEHAWDEGFGYFGASRFFLDFTIEEIANTKQGKHYKDVNKDNQIDLTSEFHFGHSTNAAKRDNGSTEPARTQFASQAFTAFVQGRAIIATATGPLSPDDLQDIQEQRDLAVDAWEKAIAATAVHYINSMLQDIQKFNTADNTSSLFLSYAKHFSELKGFALSLQFNRRSPMTSDQFFFLHEKIGITPVLSNASESDIAAYRQALLEARSILQTGYSFDSANMGDSNGKNGW